MHDTPAGFVGPVGLEGAVAGVERRTAAARRRRIQRRAATRRLSKVLFAALLVLAAAFAATPDIPTSTADVASRAAPEGGTLTIQPAWRPAGAVLTRAKAATTTPSRPFASDPREAERRDSLTRWHRIYTYSTKYRIKPELARRVYDASITAGLEPELGFRLVRVESVFNPRAVSSAGAMGLTQLMLGTARAFEPTVTREDLLDPDVNLRIGFRYLRGLIREYKGDLKLALLVYNRGPVAVQQALSMGLSPANGYETLITKGYLGRGTLD